MIIGVLAVAVAMFAFDKFVWDTAPSATTSSAAEHFRPSRRPVLPTTRIVRSRCCRSST